MAASIASGCGGKALVCRLQARKSRHRFVSVAAFYGADRRPMAGDHQHAEQAQSQGSTAPTIAAASRPSEARHSAPGAQGHRTTGAPALRRRRDGKSWRSPSQHRLVDLDQALALDVRCHSLGQQTWSLKMSERSEPKLVCRRSALTFLGYAAVFGLVASPAILAVSEAEGQTTTAPATPTTPPADAPKSGTERRQERRSGRTERRQERRTARTERRQERRTGRDERRDARHGTTTTTTTEQKK
jgi:hypothetical protein